MQKLLKTIRNFLYRHLQPNAPLLLGYSGGSDSKALLYLLLQCRSYFSFTLHLAHVDHSWRPESREEALKLSEEAEALDLPFHLKTLVSAEFGKGNLEEKARLARLNFFYELYTEHRCQALLLAHHADDQAELIFKRVCEGAHLFSLSGLSECKNLFQMMIWRPLLPVRKEMLIDYLNKSSLSFFTDPTNFSPQFLRGKMRSTLLPFVAKTFGKEVAANFCHLGEQTEELREYFIKKLSGHLDSVVRGFLGSFLPIPSALEEIEVKYLLKEWCNKENITVSREVLTQATYEICKGGCAEFPAKGGRLYIDRKRVFLLRIAPPIFPRKIPLNTYRLCNQNFVWDITMQKEESIKQISSTQTWDSLWAGKVSAPMPQEGAYELIPLTELLDSRALKTVREKRRREGVPPFLSEVIPLICQNGALIYDFLTGSYNINNNYNNLNVININIKYINNKETN